MKLKVALLGGGSWGTTVASLVARNADITLWARNSEVVDEINCNHSNDRYLPGARLNTKLKATDDLRKVVDGADVIIMGIPSHNFRLVLKEVCLFIRPWVPVVSLTKGLELDTRLRMTQVIEQELPGHPIGVLSGPNLAREVIAGNAAASVIAMEDPKIVVEMQKLFHSGLFRVYTSHDVVGCELGGVLKNIIAIATGMSDGLGTGDNTRAALISRGLAEITRLGVAMGGEQATFSGLAGMGDLVATCISAQSRNRTVGYELGKGRSLKEVTDDMFMVAEGVKSAPAVMALVDEYQVEMPIAREVFDVLQGRSTPREAFRGLLGSDAGAENQAG